MPTLFGSALIFLIGAVLLGQGIAQSRIWGTRLTRVVITALVVMAAARLVPLSAVQFYVQGVAGVVAFWPLAYVVAASPRARPALRSARSEDSMMAGHG